MKYILVSIAIFLSSALSAMAQTAHDPNACYHVTKTMSFFLIGERTRTNYEVCPVMIPETQKPTALRQWCVQLKFGDFIPRHLHCPVEVVENGGVIRAQAPKASDNDRKRSRDRDTIAPATSSTNSDSDTTASDTSSDTDETTASDTSSDTDSTGDDTASGTSSDTGETGGDTASDTSSDTGSTGDNTASDTSSDTGDSDTSSDTSDSDTLDAGVVF